MKIMVPVAGMVVAAGSCCCCGGDMTELFEEIERQINGGSSATFQEGGDEAAADAVAGDEVDPVAAAGGGSTEGLCGRFLDEGLTVPSGLKVLSCGTFGGTESVVMQGSGDPKAVCSPMKSWATGHGWTVTTEASMMDTVSVILKNADKQMTLACTNATGQTTVSLSVSQGY
ncbi:MAG: hypothetical protein ACK4YP_00905 [Myxococcota bacterium]